MAITRDSRHKRRETGGRRHPHQKKRKFEAGRPAANTKLGPKRIHLVRGRGGNLKHRALRLEVGNFSWGSEGFTHKARILDVVYNASNNELVRTKTLVKNAVVLVEAAAFRDFFEKHYSVKVQKASGDEGTKVEPVKSEASTSVKAKLDARQKDAKIDPKVADQFATGRLLAVIGSRPGQSGRADGYILEGPELEFYQRKIAQKKSGKGK